MNRKDLRQTDVFTIRKIESTRLGTLFYPKEQKEEIFISHADYEGPLPSKKKIFFNSPKLELTHLDDGYIVSAKLDGKELFKRPEEEILGHIRTSEEVEIILKEHQHLIAEALEKYLEKFTVPSYAELEKMISELILCLRVPMRAHFFKGNLDVKIYYLTYKMFKIAETVFKRHVDLSDETDTLFFRLKFFSNYEFPYYTMSHEEFEQTLQQTDKAVLEKISPLTPAEVYTCYYEVRQIMKIDLPSFDNDLLARYINQEIRKIIEFLMRDYELLRDYAVDGLWRRVLTNTEEYRRKYQKMNLLTYSSYILAEELPLSTIENFVLKYNLN